MTVLKSEVAKCWPFSDVVSGKFLVAKTKLRSCVIHIAKVRPNLLSYELPKCFGPYFIQLMKSLPLKAPTPCEVLSGLFEQFILKPNFGQSFDTLGQFLYEGLLFGHQLRGHMKFTDL